MFHNSFSSSLLEDAVEQFASLPGIGRKTALRLALHILSLPKENVEQFSSSFVKLKNEITECAECGMISDDSLCPICDDIKRDHGTICVVESLRDVLSIENTGSYKGLYHILGGLISPIDGIGVDDLKIKELVRRLEKGGINEIILALSTSMEGETTSYYLYRQVSRYPVKITAIARGVGFGDDLEYTDEMTLSRSITNRQPFNL